MVNNGIGISFIVWRLAGTPQGKEASQKFSAKIPPPKLLFRGISAEYRGESDEIKDPLQVLEFR